MTKPRDLTIIALRVLAVYLASQAFIHAANVVVFLGFPTSPALPLGIKIADAALMVSPLVAAIVIWRWAPWLAGRITHGMQTPVSPVSIEGLARMIFAVIGVWLLVTYVPTCIRIALQRWIPSTAPLVHSPVELANLIAAVVRSLLGVALITGAGLWTRWIGLLRVAGTTRPTAENQKE